MKKGQDSSTTAIVAITVILVVALGLAIALNSDIFRTDVADGNDTDIIIDDTTDINIINNGIDDDGDGLVDEADEALITDNETDITIDDTTDINVINNGIDDDGDGLVDEADEALIAENDTQDTTDMEENVSLQNTSEDTRISLEDIIENPATYVGMRVTGAAEVADFVGLNALTIESEEPLFEDELLVLVVGPTSNQVIVFDDDVTLAEELDILDNDYVQISGTLQVYSIVEVEREYDIDLDRDIEAELQDTRLVLIADNIEPAETDTEIGRFFVY